IIVSGDYDYPPYEFLDNNGRPAGANVELFRAIADVMGINYELKLGPWKDVRNDLEKGNIDLLLGMYHSPEREKIVEFSSPHTIVRHSIFVRKGSKIKSLDDLYNKEIIVQEGDIMDDFVISHKISSKIFKEETPAGVLRLLASGKYDCALLGKLQGLYFVRKLGLTNIITVGEPLTSQKYCFAVSRGNEELMSSLNEGLKILEETGRYEEIYDKWFGVLEPERISIRKVIFYTVTGLSIFLCLFFLSLFWSWSLKKQVDIRTKELKESQERLKSIMDNSSALIYIKDVQGRYVFVNKKFESLFNIPEYDAIGREDSDIFPQEAARSFQENDKKVLDRVCPLEFEETLELPDGLHTYISVKFPVCNMEGTPVSVCGITTDITERKILERKLIQSYKMEAIGRLAGGIAHDFNNILAAIIGNTEFILMEETDKPFSVNLQEILKSGIRARELVKQILTFSRYTEEVKKVINITSVIGEAFRLLRATLPKTIDIKLKTEGDNLTVFADETHIHQIFMNLCTNAAYSMREKGGTVTVDIEGFDITPDNMSEYDDLPPGAYIRLSVIDTGHGMTQDIIDKIFEPFFTTKPHGEGTGMGLSIVHGIVKNYGGTILVSSEPGKGSIFQVFLPWFKDNSVREEKEIGGIYRGSGNVLFVDDEEAIVNLWNTVLERAGYHVISFTDSRKALEAFKQDSSMCDIVITDHTMPELTGFNMAKEMLNMKPDLPVILCTGFNEEINREKVLQAGIRKFLLKPVEISELTEIVKGLMEGKK
ncbi:MAG: transporter substrate-binding domain-containing protein, partial [Candidatus Eremiobacterota bacterium]